ncbi:MAG TPA: sugar phosphate isomerase/epimerase [Bryobacteraceae bacterium]|jgi:sugar phosphate isomerase/epimerase|nr:sugar phosphate isomerase/epimerase [Bryobacteraceae bacterium]
MKRLSRRELLAASALVPLALRAGASRIPIGLQLYSVRDELAKDPDGTLSAVAKMGYQVVEFYAPYYLWNAERARQVRRLLDSLGLQCRSTHNPKQAFEPEGLKKAIELNQILGSKYIVMAGSDPISTIEGWKALSGRITRMMQVLTPLGLSSGFHNHEVEWQPINGHRPMDVLAAHTPKQFMLQLDVGSCVAAGQDSVAWIKANPGRINSIHCKDWARWFRGYRVLFGDGSAPWSDIIAAAESTGGVEFYLIEQEGSRYPPLETARRCLENWRRLRGEAG